MRASQRSSVVCLAVVCVMSSLMFLSGSGEADTISLNAPQIGGTNPLSGSPGVPFLLDFTGQGFDDFGNADLHHLIFIFHSTPVTFEHLKVDFNGLAAPVTMDAGLDDQWAEYLLYTPGHKPEGPVGNYVQVEMDPAFVTAFQDGQLDGHLWLEGASSADPTTWSVSSEATFVPEPGTLMLLGLGLAGLLSRRRLKV